MIGLTIADIKDFTDKLFKEEIFDNFLVAEAEFVTSFSVFVNGRLTEPEDDEFTNWHTIRPLAFQIIKGKQLPKSFKIVLKLSKENTIKTLASMGLPYTIDDVAGLYLNIRYDDKKILCVTGCSLNTFTMDKSLEKEWDGVIRRFLRHHQIPVEEV